MAEQLLANWNQQQKSTVDVWVYFLKYNIQNGYKTTFVVVSYSQLYEEGDVEHINCPYPPS